MKYTTEEKDLLQKIITVTVPAAEVNAALDEIEEYYRKRLKAPGFREGRAPVEMARKEFKAEIKSDSRKEIASTHMNRIISEVELIPVTQMKLDATGFPERDKDFTYKFSFYYLPEFDLPDCSQLQITQYNATADSTEVELVLQNLCHNSPIEHEVLKARTPKDGDIAIIDFAVLDENGRVKPNMEGKDIKVYVGESGALQHFEEALRKTTLGEETEQAVTFPANFPIQELAETQKNLRLKLKKLFERTPAPLDDNFARSINPEFNTVEELRAGVKEGILNRKENRFRQQAEMQLLENLLHQVEFPVPKGMIDRYKHYIMADVMEQLDRNGKTLADLNKTEEEFLADVEQEAVVQCKRQALMLRFAQKEGLNVPDREVSNYIQREAGHYGVSLPDALAEYTASGQIITVRERLLADKVMDVLYKKAQITFIPAEDKLQ